MATPDRYSHIDLTPPEGVQEAAANGVKRAEAGEGGDGLEDVTIREARAMARGEDITWFKATKLMAWWARNERFLDAEIPSAAWTAAQLWGGRAGRDWANSLRSQRDAADDSVDNDEPPAEPEERRRGSSKNDPGSASGSRGGIEISDEMEQALINKRDEHNEEYGDTEARKADLGMLKAVFRRGAGAFSSSHRRGMTRNGWALARVNAFLQLLGPGTYNSKQYRGKDNDLLPEDHPSADTGSADSSEGAMQTQTITVDKVAYLAFAEADVLSDVLIFRWGEVDHPMGEFEVDRAFASDMLSAYEAMRAEGYVPPVLAEHEDSGGGYGRVVGMRVTDEGIVVDLELAEGVREEVDSGRRIYISPSFYPEFRHPNTGEELRHALREISFVSVPHLKNLPPLGEHYTLSEQGWATTTTEQEAVMATDPTASPTEAPVENEEHDKEMEEYSMGDMRRDLGEMRKEMMEGLEAVMGLLKSVMDSEPVEDKEPEEMGETAQLSEMAARVSELVRENAEKDIALRLGEVSDEKRERLVRLRIQSREIYEDAVAALSEATKATVSTSTPERGGASPARVAPKATELAEQARVEGVPRGAKAITYLTKRGVDMSEAVDAIATVYR